MCYGEPEQLLELVLGNRDLPKNDLGHTPLDDFRDFCARTRCKEDELGPTAFAFVRVAYVTAALGRASFRRAAEWHDRPPPDAAHMVPDDLLQLFMVDGALPTNDLGHSPLDDFEHFCAYSGCNEGDLGQRAFAFVRLAYVTASLGHRGYRWAPIDDELAKARANVGMLLRDHPPGTTADIAEYCVLYWDGDELAGAHLSADQPGTVDEPFDADDVLPEIAEAVDDWLRSPVFTFRPSLLEWLKDAPPRDSSA